MDGKETDPMKPKRLLIVSLSLFTFHLSFCHAEHLFEMGIHGGVAGWAAKPVYVNSQIGFNGGAQLYYNFLSSHVIGFRTGLTIDAYQVGFGKHNYEDHYSTIDVENQQMDIDYSITNLTERYTTFSAGIPLQMALSEKNILFLVGAKAVFPFTTIWKQTAENAALSVYYPAYDNRVYESYPLAASRDFNMYNEGKLQLPKIQWWLTTELSYTIPINKQSRTWRSYIIVGAYFDYSFSKYTPDKSDAVSLIMLTDTRDGFPLQRILTPLMNANRQSRKLISDCTLFSAGLKISYAFAPYRSSRRQTLPCRCLGVW
jgi:hypothetical protein